MAGVPFETSTFTTTADRGPPCSDRPSPGVCVCGWVCVCVCMWCVCEVPSLPPSLKAFSRSLQDVTKLVQRPDRRYYARKINSNWQKWRFIRHLIYWRMAHIHTHSFDGFLDWQFCPNHQIYSLTKCSAVRYTYACCMYINVWYDAVYSPPLSLPV